jgi:hypothetical protein
MDDEPLAGGWTRAKLAGKSTEERHTVWKRARALGTPAGDVLAHAIESLGLPFSEANGLRMDDPVTIKMFEIINSPEGRQACVNATTANQPAIAGVDAMLNDALGVEYGKHNMATHTAGAIVADLMRELGYVKIGQKALPAGCIARSGVFWKPRRM